MVPRDPVGVHRHHEGAEVNATLMTTLQELPIMDRIYPGATILRPGVDHATGRGGNFTFTVGRDLYQWIASARRVKLADKERMPPRVRNGLWDVRREFGHLMLPFPMVWVEWNNLRGHDSGFPDMWMGALCVHASQCGQLAERWFEASPESFASSLMSNSWMAVIFMLDNGNVVALPYVLSVDLDESGVLAGLRGADFTGVDHADATAATADLAWEALVAIGWMNCKNVTTERNDRALNVTGRKRNRARNASKSLDFHTIILPGAEASQSHGGGSGEVVHTRLHQVRGHFKTFTPEAPLMGHHVGTYWWGWQVRGKKENGVVVSDYKVATS